MKELMMWINVIGAIFLGVFTVGLPVMAALKLLMIIFNVEVG